MTKEATARIKINKLLEAAGWRFSSDSTGAANIRLEPSVTINSTGLDALGENFEKIERMFFERFEDTVRENETIAIPAIRSFFKAYVTSDQLRGIIDNRDYTVLATHPMFSTRDFKAVPARYRAFVPEYVKDCVSLNQFAA